MEGTPTTIILDNQKIIEISHEIAMSATEKHLPESDISIADVAHIVAALEHAKKSFLGFLDANGAKGGEVILSDKL